MNQSGMMCLGCFIFMLFIDLYTVSNQIKAHTQKHTQREGEGERETDRQTDKRARDRDKRETQRETHREKITSFMFLYPECGYIGQVCVCVCIQPKYS